MTDDTGATINSDLDRVHDFLIAANEKLNASLDKITDAELAQTVVTEMREVVHRIDLVQGLLFTAKSTAISAAVEKVDAANGDLTASLKSIVDATALVNSVTKFLTLVDEAIDLAKLV